MRQWMSSYIRGQRFAEFVSSPTSRTSHVRVFERMAVAVRLQSELVDVSPTSIGIFSAVNKVSSLRVYFWMYRFEADPTRPS
jgi:hypothetical protein